MISLGVDNPSFHPLQIASPFAHLIFEKRDGGQHVVSIRHSSVVIGSAQGCRVRIRSDKVAPIHAVIFRDDGGLWIRRIDDSGRLEINKQPVTESPIKDGDVIRIGPVIVRLSTNITPLMDYPNSVAKPERLLITNLAPSESIDVTLQSGATGDAANVSDNDVTTGISQAIHQWEQLTDDVEEQSKQLSKIRDTALDVDSADDAHDHDLQDVVRELANRHERIRNELSILRLWLRPRQRQRIPNEPTDRGRIKTTHRVCFDESVNRGNSLPAYRIIKHACRKCHGEIFVAKPIRWFELPLRLAFLRVMRCATCARTSWHLMMRVRVARDASANP